jgi:hypothetical protein
MKHGDGQLSKPPGPDADAAKAIPLSVLCAHALECALKGPTI